MYGWESWTIKKAECWRIDAFELWGWRRLLRVPWAARRSNQSTLKEINPKYSLKGLMLKLKPLWPPDAKSQLTGEDPDAGNDWRWEEKGTTEDAIVGWYYWLNGHEFEQALGDSEGQGRLACCSPWGCKELDMTEQLNNNKCPQPWKWIYRISLAFVKFELCLDAVIWNSEESSGLEKWIWELLTQILHAAGMDITIQGESVKQLLSAFYKRRKSKLGEVK